MAPANTFYGTLLPIPWIQGCRNRLAWQALWFYHTSSPCIMRVPLVQFSLTRMVGRSVYVEMSAGVVSALGE